MVTRERVVRFGPDSGLVGILAEAPGGGTGAPAFVILNAGILHRVGMSRLNVVLARRLARQGHAVLRFDFSGIGDSLPRSDGRPFPKSSLEEVIAALDSLQLATGATSFVVGGLCSGAEVALRVGAEDERVEGLLLIDPQSYRTARYYLNRFGPRLLDFAVWRNSLRVRLKGQTGSSGEHSNAEWESPPLYMGDPTPRRETAARLAELRRRGTPICTVFSGGQDDWYNYSGQYGDAFARVRLGDLMSEMYIKDADHVFSDPAHQQALIEIACNWAKHRWPPHAA